MSRRKKFHLDDPTLRMGATRADRAAVQVMPNDVLLQAMPGERLPIELRLAAGQIRCAVFARSFVG